MLTGLSSSNIFGSKAIIGVLVFQFFLSGIYILSTIFTMPKDIQNLAMWMFLSLSLGSFVAGTLADFVNRRIIFHVCSTILIFSSLLIQFNHFGGYILAALAIGPLNNLTFVLIMENFYQNKDNYTIMVLIGWGFSQVFLGLYFFFEFSINNLYLILFFSTTIYYVSSLLLIPNSDVDILNISELSITRLIPKTLKPLIGGCLLMFAVQMFYYRTQFTLDKFGISMPINTLVVGCMEIAANLLLTQRLSKVPRKKTLQILLSIIIILFISLLLVKQSVVQTIIEGIMRFVDTLVMIILGVYIPQLFPTHQKSRGTNFIMSFGVLGSAFSQYLLNSVPFWSLSIILTLALSSTISFHQTKIIPQYQETKDEYISN